MQDDWYETDEQAHKENTARQTLENVDENEASTAIGYDEAEMSVTEDAPNLSNMIEEETSKIVQEIQRIANLAKEAEAPDTLHKALMKWRQRLTNVRHPNQAVSTVITFSMAANKHIRRGGRINVQPTSLARRREGTSRGAKRIPAGRPSTAAPPGKVHKRRPHNLSQAIKSNVASITSHKR